MGAQYRFVDTWTVPAPIDEVYEIVGDTLRYPEWWGASFLEVTGDEGPPRPGRRASVVARGFLPYRIRWSAVVTEADPPNGFSIELSGDFEGGGRWILTPEDGATRAELDWRPAVTKPLVRYLTPILRPLFAKNHYWAMDRGQEGILRLIEQRRADERTRAAPPANAAGVERPAARS
jgi:uncharacterized protein YndB with AHSA1/START domain